jgi:predicted amidophosphoribosyltransferase
MAKYTLCPRCELNYILEGEEYCAVCKAELKIGPQLMFSVDGDVKDQILCPVCKQRYIDEDEEMCQSCREEMDYAKHEEELDDGDSWRQYLDDDEKEELSSQGDEEEIVKKLLKERLVDVVASDWHSTRKNYFKAAYEKVEAKYGDYARLIFSTNPTYIAKNGN